MKIKKIRRALTLIEMLIVIALIGIIGSALAYNMGAGLNKGKEFRSEQNRRKVRNVLDYEIFNNGHDPHEVVQNWKEYVSHSSLIDRDQKLEDLFKDGYGGEYHVSYDEQNDQIVVRSSRDAGY